MINTTTWNGKKSTQWFDPENWTHGIPSTNLHAYIPSETESGRFPSVAEKLCIDFTLKNDGKFANEGLIVLKENGIFQNAGIFENHEIATLVNSGNMTNTGELINSGTLDNHKIFTNHGKLHNEGLFENENTVVNPGSWMNTGTIDNFGLISNAGGTLENYNIIENKDQGKIENKGFIPEDLINDFSPIKYTPSIDEIIFQKNTIE